jgi:predicted O-linked N-acetylglucosamine transferase (SPINDLY family)
MDPIGLQALSLRPAPHQFKWVGGQSVTTGLNCFAGWIGDENQSPKVLQSWYSEPLINATEGYASYTPPPYMPKPARLKSKSLCIFSNPAKISREFLMALRQMKGEKVFIHRQYRFPRVQHRILEALEQKATFISPASHQEALQAVNQHQTMIDTFPYSSGLTAREALALGTKIKVLRVGELFCERHTAYLASP